MKNLRLHSALCRLMLGIPLAYSMLVNGSADIATVSHRVSKYEHETDHGSSGHRYLNWPGTFGATRVRPPVSWKPLSLTAVDFSRDGQSVPDHTKSA